MNASQLKTLLDQVAAGQVDPGEAESKLLDALRERPFEDLGFARIDHHRAVRQGFPEVVLGLGKTPAQVAAISQEIVKRGATLLVTRASPETYEAVRELIPGSIYLEQARLVTFRQQDIARGEGTILVIAAGTSDLPVAEEAALTVELAGNRVERIYDVGVAGLHRLLAHRERIAGAEIVVVAAGMEGALPSVVAGLFARPVIAVPTSVGYGASLGGIAALLGMLNSCASGVAVMNIDNGFGAGRMAAMLNRATAA